MIAVAVEAVVDPAAVERVRGALAKMERASRAEPGCLTYAFSVDVNDPSMVRITELWKSMQDLEAHFATAHMAEFRQAVGALQPTSLKVKAYEVAREVALPGS
jgi:quinol monooxygenase YgiN